MAAAALVHPRHLGRTLGQPEAAATPSRSSVPAAAPSPPAPLALADTLVAMMSSRGRRGGGVRAPSQARVRARPVASSTATITVGSREPANTLSRAAKVSLSPICGFVANAATANGSTGPAPAVVGLGQQPARTIDDQLIGPPSSPSPSPAAGGGDRVEQRLQRQPPASSSPRAVSTTAVAPDRADELGDEPVSCRARPPSTSTN